MIRNNSANSSQLRETKVPVLTKQFTKLCLFLTAYILLVTCDEILDIAPPEVEIVSPTQGEIDTGYVHISIEVSDNKQLDYVDLYFDGNKINTFTIQTQSRASLQDTVDLADYQQDKDYKIEAKAYDAQGNWETDAVTCFGYGKSPDPPTLVIPSVGALLTSQPTFRWNALPDVIGYQLVVDNNQDFSTPETDTLVTGTEYISTDTLIAGTNYWKVRAQNNVGLWGSWSSTRNFTISGSIAPTLVSPGDATVFTNTNTPTFNWNQSTDAVEYHIVVDDNQNFASPEIDEVLTETEYTATVSLNAGTNYWKVRARNNVGLWGSWSSAINFTIAGPEAPTLVDPPNGTVFTNTAMPTFSWNSSTNAVDYQILVDNNQDFASPEIDGIVVGTGYTSTVSLNAGANYWKVRSRNNLGLWGEWTSVWSFAVSGPAVPTLVSPSNGASLTAPYTFHWNTTTDAVDYEIIVDNEENFTSPEIDEIVTSTEYTYSVSLNVGTNYWKVRARNNVGLWGDWTHVWSFIIVIELTEVGYYYTSHDARSIAVTGDYAYVVAWGLLIIDVSSPGSPNEVGSYWNPNYRAWDVAMSGNYAYIVEYSYGLRVINVYDPSSPIEVGSYQTPGNATGVAVSGTYVYVAEEDLRIIDVLNPDNPNQIGYYQMPGSAYDVTVSGNYAFVVGGYGLRVINVSNPYSPTEVGSYSTGGGMLGVTVSNNYAYVSDGYLGLQVFDVSSGIPSKVGSYNTPGYANGITVTGNYAYVADDSSGLLVIDISSPESPLLVGYYDTPGSAFDVAISGNYAYVADGLSGLRIIDISPFTGGN